MYFYFMLYVSDVFFCNMWFIMNREIKKKVSANLETERRLVNYFWSVNSK